VIADQGEKQKKHYSLLWILSGGREEVRLIVGAYAEPLLSIEIILRSFIMSLAYAYS